MKNGWKKGLSMALVTMLIVGACSGCGKGANDKDEQGRTMISVGEYPTKEDASKANYDARLEAFGLANPDIAVTPDTWSFDLKSFYAKAEGGQLPTVFRTNYTELAQCVDAGYVADLTDAFERNGILDKFNRKILEAVERDGRYYAFPASGNAMGLVYNTELFEAAGLAEEDGTPKQPKDWNEVVEFAKKIKAATGKAGFVFPTANKVGGWIFSCLAWSFGVDFMEQNEDGSWVATFDSPECAEALQWIKDLKWKHDVIPSNTIIDNTEYYKTFSTGNAGMMIITGDFPKRVVQYGMTPDQLGMMALPAGPKAHVTLFGGSLNFVSADTTEDQQDAALKWILHGNSPYLTETVKQAQITTIEEQKKNNQLIGVKTMGVWNEDAEVVSFVHNLIDQNANSNPNHVKLYNEFLKSDVELRPEEPVCCQELYGVLDDCIQAVLLDKDADCASILKKACSEFQQNYLDHVDY